MKTLILTPNRNEQCGMYQLAKDLAKELNADIKTLIYKNKILQLLGETSTDKFQFSSEYLKDYDEVITFLYPMHLLGQQAKEMGKKWICYDQKIPPVTKQYFPNFWRRQYMKIFNKLNAWSMKGANEYWDVTEREQKPRWTEKTELVGEFKKKPYAIYLGRETDYKNFDKLLEIMEELSIPIAHPENLSNEEVHHMLSNAKMLVTASIWEGFGRPCNEAQALKIYTVCFNTGAHNRLVKYGAVVPNHNFELFKQKIKEFWYDGIEERKE